MPTHSKRRPHGLAPLEHHGPQKASSGLPSEERPMIIAAPGLQAAREAAGMSVEELAIASNCDPRTIILLEGGGRAHMVAVSRASSGLPTPHNDLRPIRGFGHSHGDDPSRPGQGPGKPTKPPGKPPGPPGQGG